MYLVTRIPVFVSEPGDPRHLIRIQNHMPNGGFDFDQAVDILTSLRVDGQVSPTPHGLAKSQDSELRSNTGDTLKVFILRQCEKLSLLARMIPQLALAAD